MIPFRRISIAIAFWSEIVMQFHCDTYAFMRCTICVRKPLSIVIVSNSFQDRDWARKKNTCPIEIHIHMYIEVNLGE